MRRAFLFIVLLLNTFIIFSQADKYDLINTIIPPSPDASSLGEYGEYPVSISNGTPDITIPLFEIKSGNTSIPISISYHASGNQVNGVASWVGLGWALNAGGVVTRSVRGGFHDEFFLKRWEPHGPVGEHDWFYYTGYFMYNSNYWGTTTPSGRLDAEPDLFFYNIPGESNKFVFNRQKQVVKIPFYQTKIEYDWGDPNYMYPEESFTKFYITNTNGTKYQFDVFEGTHSLNLSNQDYAPHLKDQDFISSWYLSKITDAYGYDAFTFEYNDIGDIDYGVKNVYTFYDPFYYGSSCGNVPPTNDRDAKSTLKVKNAKKLRKINFNDGYVLFEATHVRQDLLGDRALTSIELYNNNDELIKKYEFQYEYSCADCNGGPDNKRMFLKRVIEIGNDNKIISQYSFYYNPTVLPDRDSYKTDYWGFYNHNVTTYKPKLHVYPDLQVNMKKNMISIFSTPPVGYTGRQFHLSGSDKSCNSTDILAGVLEKIEFPTGGYTEFTYEPHQFYYLGQNRTGGGIRIKKIKKFDGISHDNDQEMNYYYTLKDIPGRSSGTIGMINTYGFLCVSDAGITDYNQLLNHYEKKIMRKSVDISNLGSMYGPNITYSEVKEEQVGKGYTIYKYSSYSDFPDTAPEIEIVDVGNTTCNPDRTIETSFYPFSPNTNMDFARGNLKSVDVFNNDGLKVSNTTNTYRIIQNNSIPIEFGVLFQGPWDGNAWIEVYADYNILSSVSVPLTTTKKTYTVPNNETSVIITTNSYEFNDVHLHKVSDSHTDNLGVEHSTKYYYPQNFLKNGSNAIWSLYNKNMLNTVIKEHHLYKKPNDSLMFIGGKHNVYTTKNNIHNSYFPVLNEVRITEMIAPIKFSDYNSNLFYPELIINQYDNYGNIESYYKKDVDNPHISVIWAYDHSKPVVLAENVEFQILETAVNNALNTANGTLHFEDFTDLLNINQKIQWNSFNTALRELLPDASISTFTYIPLVGVSSKTGPDGKITYYEYDENNKLKNIRNFENKIVSNTQYHYRDYAYSIPSSISCGLSGGQQSITVYANNNWEIIDVPNWITLSQMQGENKSIIGVTINSSTTNRTGTFKIKTIIGESVFNITQSSNYVDPDISGYIYDQSGNPVENVKIFVNGSLKTTTSSTGYYSLDVNEEITNYVQPIKEGYVITPSSRVYENNFLNTYPKLNQNFICVNE